MTEESFAKTPGSAISPTNYTIYTASFANSESQIFSSNTEYLYSEPMRRSKVILPLRYKIQNHLCIFGNRHKKIAMITRKTRALYRASTTHPKAFIVGLSVAIISSVVLSYLASNAREFGKFFSDNYGALMILGFLGSAVFGSIIDHTIKARWTSRPQTFRLDPTQLEMLRKGGQNQ